MGFGWQDLASLAAVVAAVVFLAYRFRRAGAHGESTGCGTCPGCSTAPTDRPLVTIKPLAKKRDS